MSRKNRSKFIAFRLNNNQICKAAFVQYDESAARQISAHQPQPAATGTAWTAQHLPHPRPAPRRGRGRKTRRGQRPAPAPKEASTATKASRRTEGHPAAPSRCNPPASQTAEPAPPRRWKGEDRETGERKGKRNGQKMTVKERRPACTPDRASAQALRPYCQQSQHTRPENSPGERQRIGESIPLLWSMQNRP